MARALPGVELTFDDGSTVFSLRFERFLGGSTFGYSDESSVSFSATGAPVVSGSARAASRTWAIVSLIQEPELRQLLGMWEGYRAKEASGLVATILVKDETFPYSIDNPLETSAVIESPPQRPAPSDGPLWFPASLTLMEV